MARIAEADIERLKQEVSVLQLAEARGIALQGRGANLLGRCPFHADKTPSLVITPEKNLWHCLGACQAGGGPIDWVMRANGVSFRHAVELLRADSALAAGAGAPAQVSRPRKLAPPVAPDAADGELLNQVIDFYHQSLLESPEALAYLARRGLTDPDMIARFRVGHANRTLGYRLPAKSVKAGADLKGRLQQIGILRESGHEHFNGSIVVPVFDLDGNVTEAYARKLRDDLRTGTPLHLYLPGPHRGVWNEAALQQHGEIILCEALIDALTFWQAGFHNVTASYGVTGFTPDHLAAFQRHDVKRVLIAYDRDAAGDTAAASLAEQLVAAGIECYRVNFPKGMDANGYALKVTPASKSLGILIRKAAWMGQGAAPQLAPGRHLETSECAATAPTLEAAPVVPLAASPVSAPAADAIAAEVKADEVVFTFGERRYRVRGLPKNLSPETLKVNLLVSSGEPFHVDTLDLYSAKGRSHYLQQAAKELGVVDGLIRHDLGRILLKLEALQDERIKAATSTRPAAPAMSEAEREAALGLLRAPDLLERIVADLDACGLVGERTNKLVGYLAAVSRKLDRPLAIVVQSSSAAGKSSLMDAVLAMMPQEERIKYSAMTGQSLFYMGETNLRHKILAIVEEEGASRASYALKLLQSEGELMIASTGKDAASGNLTTQEYRVTGPVMIFLTTTAIEIDEELMNRCIVLTVDEGRTQTEAIHSLQRARRTLGGLMAKQGKETILALHRNAQRLLRPLAVVNPYADQLTFLSDKTRTRRDHEKYLTLIDTIALLHQCQRTIRTANGPDGAALEYIEVIAADIAQANRLTHEVLGRSLDELPPQTRRLLVLVAGMVAGCCAAQGSARKDVRFSRKDVRVATGWGDTQLKIHLGRLAELEYLLVHRAERGQGHVYELLYDGDGRTAPHLIGLLDAGDLDAYDKRRSGAGQARSAPGRGAVGGWSAPGRDAPSAGKPVLARVPAEPAMFEPENARPRTNGHGPVVVASATGEA
jgi:DNA primase